MTKFETYYAEIQNAKATYRKAETEVAKEAARATYHATADKVNKEGKTFTEIMRAYETARDNENEGLDFNEVLWEKNIPGIADCLKENGITEFTISSTYSSVMDIFAAFEKEGYKLEGLTKVNGRVDIFTNERETLNAVRFTLA